MISIIIPVYNQAKRLARCLESIGRQTDQNFEVIVINDGSLENIGRVIDKFNPRFGAKLKYFRQINQGAPAARNRGAREAQGDYLLFCDADVILNPDMLEVMRQALDKHPEAAYVYSSFKFGGKIFRLWPFDVDKLRQMPYIHTTSLLRSTDFPGFDESLKRFQDWDLWLTLAEKGRYGLWLDQVLFKMPGGDTMSRWLPAAAYRWLPRLRSVKAYRAAEEIVKKKHGDNGK